MRTKTLFLISLPILAFSTGLRAANAPTTPVFVVSSSSGTDVAGEHLVFDIKEAIKKSAGFRLVYSDNDASLIIHVETTPTYTPDMTAFAFTITAFVSKDVGETYLNSNVGTCGVAVTESCAKTVLSSLDSVDSNIRAEFEKRSR